MAKAVYAHGGTSACFAPADVGAGAIAEAREGVDVHKVVVLCERRQERPGAIVWQVCALRSGNTCGRSVLHP